jgi:type IV fimbrial biogenesis protein FimT
MLRAQGGVSLIELMVAIAVFAILIMAGLPSFNTWMQNSQIRTTAEAIQNGLSVARGAAVQRNTQVRFQLASTTDSTCALSTTVPNWVVSLDDPSGACDVTASDVTAPRIIQIRTTAEGTRNAVVVASQSTVIFNGLGRVTPVPAGNITIDISNPTGGTCATAGPMRCLRVVVSTGGQVRMCDPGFPATDPQGCGP